MGPAEHDETPEEQRGFQAGPGESSAGDVPPPVQGRRFRRSVDVNTVGALFVGLPSFLLSAAVVFLVGGLLGVVVVGSNGAPGIGVFALALWLASGALAFHRPTEASVSRHMFKTREPTSAEQSQLEPVWATVTDAAGIGRDTYDLWVESTDDLTAHASMGHNVAVSNAALTHLSPRQLAAVLAHELGHHVGGHSWSALLMWWYALPGRVFVRVSLAVVGGVLRALIAMFPVLGLIAAVLIVVGVLGTVFAVVTTPSGLPIVLLVLSPLLLPWLSRRGELQADRTAIDLGFGPELIEALETMTALQLEDPRHGLRQQMFASHPRLDVRIQSAYAYLRAQP
jgi:STE24 endopeptidase